MGDELGHAELQGLEPPAPLQGPETHEENHEGEEVQDSTTEETTETPATNDELGHAELQGLEPPAPLQGPETPALVQRPETHAADEEETYEDEQNGGKQRTQ